VIVTLTSGDDAASDVLERFEGRVSTRRGGMHSPEERVMVNVLAAVIIQV
jgi:hypothetical protein